MLIYGRDIGGEDIARKKRTEEKILQRIRFEWQRDGDIFIGNMNI